MPAFLTDDWFANVEKLTAEAGDLNLPASLSNLALNLVVTGGGGTTGRELDSGRIGKGASANARTTLTLDAETLRKVFLEFDMAAAMQAFMTGKIKVQGDMSQLMALQTAKPSQEQKDLFKKVLEQTA